jgi:hypothetical protein
MKMVFLRDFTYKMGVFDGKMGVFEDFLMRKGVKMGKNGCCDRKMGGFEKKNSIFVRK